MCRENKKPTFIHQKDKNNQNAQKYTKYKITSRFEIRDTGKTEVMKIVNELNKITYMTCHFWWSLLLLYLHILESPYYIS